MRYPWEVYSHIVSIPKSIKSELWIYIDTNRDIGHHYIINRRKYASRGTAGSWGLQLVSSGHLVAAHIIVLFTQYFG